MAFQKVRFFRVIIFHSFIMNFEIFILIFFFCIIVISHYCRSMRLLNCNSLILEKLKTPKKNKLSEKNYIGKFHLRQGSLWLINFLNDFFGLILGSEAGFQSHEVRQLSTIPTIWSLPSLSGDWTQHSEYRGLRSHTHSFTQCKAQEKSLGRRG